VIAGGATFQASIPIAPRPTGIGRMGAIDWQYGGKCRGPVVLELLISDLSDVTIYVGV
jgi:hypothetical protein